MTENNELIQGPVPRWTPTSEDEVVIEELLASEDELGRAYGEAYRKGLFIKEFGGKDDEHGVAAVGEMDSIAIAALRLGKDIDEVIEGLDMGDCMSLGTFPGLGNTRAERVLDSVQKALAKRTEELDPEALDPYGSFVENGYRVEAFMPRNSEQPTQWTVKVFKEGEEEPLRIETIPMMHEPIFGVDIDDESALENKVAEIMLELLA